MTERRRYLALVALILLAVIGAALVAVPGSPLYKKPVLGLDLQGGLEVVLKAQPPRGHQLTAEDLDRSVQIMQERVNKTGVSEPDIRKQGTNQIVVQLAGVHNQAKAAALIGKTAQLMIWDFEPNLTGPSKNANGQPVAVTSLYDLLTQLKGQAAKGQPESYYLFKNTTTPAKKKGAKPVVKHSVKNSAPTLKDLLQPYGGKVPEGFEVMKVPQNRIVVSCPAANGCPGATAASPTGTYYYVFKYFPNSKDGPPELTGKDLKSSGIRADIDPQSGQWITLLDFSNHGSNQFQKITKAEYQRGQANATLAGVGGNHDPTTVQQYAGHSAIVLDQVLQSTPYIDYTQSSLQNGIAGGAQITTGSQTEAKDLATVLQTGALPVTFKQIERTDVSATLGKASLTQAWHAAVVGLLLVCIFLLVIYRFLGLVAVIGLAIYALLFYAALLLFNVTLTLPGFAGLILTIGVAADANVVVFERIKEEVRAGKSVRAAIAAGYGKGFHTILDANVVTAITALVLFLIAVASVKGFALTLLIGTLISLLTAVVATRALLGLLAGFRWAANPRFMGAQGVQTAKWLQIDFMAKRYLWFAISGAVIVAGAVALGAKGLNLGIDFKGGTQVTFSTHKGYTTEQVRQIAASIDRPDAVVQGRGTPIQGNQYRQWQVTTRALTQRQQDTFQEDLSRQLGAFKSGTKNVSSSFGHQIALDAIWGILVSLFLIVIYIALRFDFKFAIPVILAMLHDIVITVGIYALIGKEVSVATVAAVLTVLGYSIYDTIIIFDRIRENIPLMRRQPFATIANVSLWETIRRSLATTFITLLPIIALEVLGGQTLKDFAIALIIGVTAGAYSSIFIAAPLLTIWKEREPEYAKKKQLARPEDETAAWRESEAALAAEPTPELLDVVQSAPSTQTAQASREKRRQRRRTRPHGRAR